MTQEEWKQLKPGDRIRSLADREPYRKAGDEFMILRVTDAGYVYYLEGTCSNNPRQWELTTVDNKQANKKTANTLTRSSIVDALTRMNTIGTLYGANELSSTEHTKQYNKIIEELFGGVR